MSYIVQRQDRFYVVAYDGLDPLTGRERRRWHPVGHDRTEAEQLAERLDRDRDAVPAVQAGPITFGELLTNTWVPHKRRQLRATTAYRYAWFVERYIRPALGQVPLRRLRADHLDHLYDTLESAGGRGGQGLAPKTVHEVHAVVRASLDHAVERRLVDRNVAHRTKDRRRPPASCAARSWTAPELNAFLTAARGQRLFPALHLAAHTGMRRGEIVGLKWSDLSVAHSRLSVSRTVQNVGGRPVEFGVKTRTSRRSVELDRATLDELMQWRRRLDRNGLPCGPDDWMFCNAAGRFLNPESISQLFERIVQRNGLPRIRFHDLRHTHASLLVADGTAIKVVSERLGHAHPAFTMHTYQHVLPGMSAAAAERFATLVADASR
ncbi:MAG: tyrosine-type recombinase/integrase [Ilumatobacteraceae bacterium]